MAFNINQFIDMHRFVWETDSLGKILVHNLNSTAESALRKAIKKYIDADSKVFVKTLITNVCQFDSNNSGEYTDDRITLEQADKLSDEELNEFACNFLKKNLYLENDYSKSKSKKKKNKDGNVVATIQYERRIDARKLDNESYCDLLKRLIHLYRVHEEESSKRLFDSLKPKNIEETLGARSLYGKSFAHMAEDTLGIKQLGLNSPLQSAIAGFDSINEMRSVKDAITATEVNSFSKSIMETLGARNLYDKSLAHMAEDTLGIKQLGLNSPLQSAIAGFDSINGMRSVKDAIAAAEINSFSKSIMETLDARNLYDKSLAHMAEDTLGIKQLGLNSPLQSAIAGFDSINGMRSVKDAIAAAEINSFSKSIMGTLGSRYLYDKSFSDLLNQESSICAFQNAMGILAKPGDFSIFLDSITSDEELRNEETIPEDEHQIDEIEVQLEEIKKAKDLDTLVSVFKKLPVLLKHTLIFIFVYLVVPSYFKHHLECNLPLINCDATEQHRKKNIKQIKSNSAIDINLKNYRFISKDILNLYDKPKLRSEIKDTLHFGKTVYVVNKQRSWMEVTYLDDNGAINQGWILSRYAVKFLRGVDQII